jgi:arylsulfatase B
MAKFSHINDIHRRIFAAMLAHLDDSVGRVIAALRDNGIEDNTLVVFLSDNGGPTRELTSSNAPLRGGKGELREGGIRVPYIVSWKGRISPHVVESPVVSMDATAAALEMAGAEFGKTKIDGVSFMPFLTGNITELSDRTLFWRVGKKHALRDGDWKLIRDGKEWQLFDLAHDPSETADLAAKEINHVRILSALWDQWNAEQIEPLWK